MGGYGAKLHLLASLPDSTYGDLTLDIPVDKQIEIEVFQGPLEVLLTLVQCEEISLTRVRLIEVLDQVIRGLKGDVNLDDGGDTLMILSTLMELKSRLLLPGEVDLSQEISALKEDLLSKIMVHRRLSEVLDVLGNRFDRMVAMHPRPYFEEKKEETLQPLENQNPFTLLQCLEGLRDKPRQDSFRMAYNILSVDHYLEWLPKVTGKENFDLLKVACLRKDTLDATGVFIAGLELVRQNKLIFTGDEEQVEGMKPQLWMTWTDDEESTAPEVHPVNLEKDSDAD